MQEIKIHCLANGVVGTYRDYLNASAASPPTIVKGVEVLFSIRLFSRPNSPEPYDIELLRNVVAWKFALDKDFDENTNFILEADNASITLNSIEEEGQSYTELSIPLPETNTVELSEWMGSEKSKSGLVAELSGYDENGKAVFVLQLENFAVRNRLGGSGSPEGLDPDYLTEAQVRALVKTEAAAYAPKINAEGDWEVAGVDTNVKAAGEPGKNLQIDAVGSFEDRSLYDNEPKNFTFLADGKLYIKLSDTSGDWSDPIQLTPKRGIDYWTTEDIQNIKDFVEAVILNGAW
jgi:hypothetical protein